MCTDADGEEKETTSGQSRDRRTSPDIAELRPTSVGFLVYGQVTIIFVVSVCLSVCLFVQSFTQPSLIRFRSNYDTRYMSGSSCVP